MDEKKYQEEESDNISTNDKNSNPYDICIWKNQEICNNCAIKGKLQCHEDFHYSFWFGLGTIPTMILSLVGLLRADLPLYSIILGIVTWIGYLIYFFLIWEPKMLCSHCPYYAEGNTKILHCYANHGFYKTAKFNPYPLTKSEKAQFILGIFLFTSIPLPFIFIGGEYLIGIFVIIGIISWIILLQTKICKDCVNFSCPLNRVPKNVVVSFLKSNLIMEKAWRESGFDFDEDEN